MDEVRWFTASETERGNARVSQTTAQDLAVCDRDRRQSSGTGAIVSSLRQLIASELKISWPSKESPHRCRPQKETPPRNEKCFPSFALPEGNTVPTKIITIAIPKD
eukprot:5801065-Amphidinium_carterae.1